MTAMRSPDAPRVNAVLNVLVRNARLSSQDSVKLQSNTESECDPYGKQTSKRSSSLNPLRYRPSSANDLTAPNAVSGLKLEWDGVSATRTTTSHLRGLYAACGTIGRTENAITPSHGYGCDVYVAKNVKNVFQ